MYRQSPIEQVSFENFYLPFGGKLSGENRWVRLAKLVPWEIFESEYAEQFSPGQGAPAKPFRIALGALIIKEKIGTSDEETVEQIRENPYLQYFLGLSEYSDKARFESSMMVHFRKRLNLEIVGRINEQIVKSAKESGQKELEEKPGKNEEKLEEQKEQKEEKETEPANQGKLLLDATVAPADIRYPTDIKLLNEAREQTEIVIDALYQQVKEQAVLSNPKLAWSKELCVNVVDSAYGNKQFLSPLQEHQNLVTVARSRSNRVFYQSPVISETPVGRGHPTWYGARFDTKEPDTWPEPTEVSQFSYKTRRGRILANTTILVLLNHQCFDFSCPIFGRLLMYFHLFFTSTLSKVQCSAILIMKILSCSSNDYCE